MKDKIIALLWIIYVVISAIVILGGYAIGVIIGFVALVGYIYGRLQDD